MKLLICTQKVDKNDPLLGFFHGWIKEFSKRCELVTVISLEKGHFDLPENVRVLSLGKDCGGSVSRHISRAKYIFTLYKYIWQNRKNFDSVFVHMNQEYVLLSGLLWRAWGKKILMWRNHPHGSFLTKIAVNLSHVVFCTSDKSYTAQFSKTQIMPVGIDTNAFINKHKSEKANNTGLYIGRISPIKNIEIMIEAVADLKKKDLPVKLLLVGDSPGVDGSSGGQVSYLENLKRKVESLGLEDYVSFISSISNSETVAYYNRTNFSINATPSGSFDKTIFEAMACEQIVFVSNKSLEGKIDERLIFQENNPLDLSIKIENFLGWPELEKEKVGRRLREFVVGEHSLSRLIDEVYTIASRDRYKIFRR